MAKRYNATLFFTGLASLSIDAENVEEAREKLINMTIEDLARQGHVDITQLKIVPRQVTISGAVLAGDDGEDGEYRPIGKRPSGWYRPV
jgi:hypothetical protein